jgi:phage terminase small subunit
VTKEKIKKNVVANMKHLGVYRDDFENTIDIYVDMLIQYEAFRDQFNSTGFKITEQYTNKAGATNERKTPVYTALESLRKDIAKYSDLLCLNPRAYERVKKPDVPVRKKEDEKPKSKLVQFLSDRA